MLRKALYYHSFVSSNLYDLDIYFILPFQIKRTIVDGSFYLLSKGFEPEAVSEGGQSAFFLFVGSVENREIQKNEFFVIQYVGKD